MRWCVSRGSGWVNNEMGLGGFSLCGLWAGAPANAPQRERERHQTNPLNLWVKPKTKGEWSEVKLNFFSFADAECLEFLLFVSNEWVYEWIDETNKEGGQPQPLFLFHSFSFTNWVKKKKEKRGGWAAAAEGSKQIL